MQNMSNDVNHVTTNFCFVQYKQEQLHLIVLTHVLVALYN